MISQGAASPREIADFVTAESLHAALSAVRPGVLYAISRVPHATCILFRRDSRRWHSLNLTRGPGSRIWQTASQCRAERTTMIKVDLSCVDTVTRKHRGHFDIAPSHLEFSVNY